MNEIGSQGHIKVTSDVFTQLAAARERTTDRAENPTSLRASQPQASAGHSLLRAPAQGSGTSIEPAPLLRLVRPPAATPSQATFFHALRADNPGLMTRAHFRAELERLSPGSAEALAPAQVEELFLGYRGYLQETRRTEAATNRRAPVLGKDLASIDTLANGYLANGHDADGDGAIDLATEAEGPFVRSDGKTVFSSNLAMSRAADQLGNRDGKVTAQEYRGFLAQFDTGDAFSPAGDGFLSGREHDAWYASGLLPTSRPIS